MAKTRAQENRAIRQESLREQLSKQKHIEQVVKNIKKMEGLTLSIPEVINGEQQDAHFMLNKLKIANEQRMKLISKYLPDLKNVEIANDGGGELTIKLVDYSIDHND